MATQDRSELTKKTVKELREIAKELALTGYSRLKKAELINAIIKESKAQAKSGEIKKPAAKAAPVTGANTQKDMQASAKAKTTPAPKAKADAKAKAKPEPKAKQKADTKTETKTAANASAKAQKASKPSATEEKATPLVKRKEEKLAVAKIKKGSSAMVAAEKAAVPELAKKKEAKDVLSEADALDKETAESLALLEQEAAAALAELKAAEEAILREPDTIYIDKGMLIPSYVRGTRLRVLVRDPGTTFVYWDSEFENPEGWQLTAYNRDGVVLDSFRSSARRAGSGYFHIPSLEIARVSLAIIRNGKIAETKLQSQVSLRNQIKTLKESEKWVDFHSKEIVHEAPAPGRAPQQHSPESLHLTPKDQARYGAPSSWIHGAAQAPSSDELLKRS
ncbi:MAG: Rho termination factor N-terminal domain-containing protein [Bradymonadales bacterium]